MQQLITTVEYVMQILNIKVSACDDFKRAGELGLFEAYQVIKDYCEEKDKPKGKSKK